MKKIKTIVIITVSLVGLTWLLSGGLGLFTNLPIPINREDVILVLLLVGTGLVIYFVAKDDGGGGSSGSKPTTINVG